MQNSNAFGSNISSVCNISSDNNIYECRYYNAWFLSGNKSVGLYSVSTKIYTIVKQMLAAIIIVSIPRLSAYLGEKK